MITLNLQHLGASAFSMSNEELGILLRLLLCVVTEQRHLPLGLEECKAIAQATNRDAQRALGRVLARHFELTPLGRIPNSKLLHVQAALQLAPALDSDYDKPEGSGVYTGVYTRDNEASTRADTSTRVDSYVRQKRYRLRRDALVQQARRMGLSPLRTDSMEKIRAMIDKGQNVYTRVDATSTPVVTPLARAPGIPRIQDTEDKGAGSARARSVTPSTPPSPAGLACMAMRAAGLQGCNPGHPTLLALLDAGMTVDELAAAAADSALKGKGFAYALAMAEGRKRDAAAAEDAKQRAIEGWMGPELVAMMRGER